MQAERCIKTIIITINITYVGTCACQRVRNVSFSDIYILTDLSDLSSPFFPGSMVGVAVLQQECIGVVYINNKNNNNKTVSETPIPDLSFVVFL